jgi:hypothetical protein
MVEPDPGRAWGWVASLRDGGTTPWSQWPAGRTAAPSARDLPGVQQLELARRVNLAAEAAAAAATPGEVHPARRAAVVARALTATPAGRGAPERELAGAVPHRAWGLPPVEPDDLRDDDLLRLAATLVAEDLVAAARAGHAAPPGSPRTDLPARAARCLLRAAHHRGPHRHGHRVAGGPWLALHARDELLRRGRPLGADPRSRTVVVGDDAAAMLVDAYTARAFGAGVSSWERWLGRGPDRALPPAADLAAGARRWAATAGPGGLVVVADPALLPQALGLPDRARARLAPPRPGADAVDLARRVTAPLALLVVPDERRRLLRRVLLPQLLHDATAHAAPPLGVPREHLPWLVRRAEQVRDDLRDAGYPVLGDLRRLVPDAAAATGAGPDDAGVLALAVRLLLAAPPRHPEHPQHPGSEDT